MKRGTTNSFFAVVCILLVSAVACAQPRRRARPTGESVTLMHAGQQREYRIHVPRSYTKETPMPLVVSLHGGGGTSKQSSRMGLTSVADRHGFVVVYPNAIDKHWNDGRESPRFAEHDRTIDDVAFIIAIIKRVSNEYNIDARRVFATGISNGGFMTQRLAMEHPELFSAVGIVIASMGEPLNESFDPELPVSVLYMNGTEDPLVPYGGGEVAADLFPRLSRLKGGSKARRGSCVSTNDAVALWVKRNGCTQQPTVTRLPDKDATDGSTVELSVWADGESGTAVALYKVIGGGHSLPGGSQYLPERLIGRTNRDIDGYEVMWQFFTDHARGKASGQ